jgi:predicted tellurium resistance membrane protein TerC
MQPLRSISAVRWGIVCAAVLLIAMLAFGVWANEVWRPWVPACARSDPGTCLMWPDGSVH